MTNRLVPHANLLILGYFEVPESGSKSQKLVNEYNGLITNAMC
ncbi:hypothetical protein SAMN05421644_1421 [Allochromatium warmingii]|uniref:Uncharacterized protein n=1 Tax=Allochromatium warmingii TaxID=61595 RepID=A0A1H3IB81_ALLWA|nr:hypothetical protein SAMN05421644_1421 [Allochromatium warmingii]